MSGVMYVLNEAKKKSQHENQALNTAVINVANEKYYDDAKKRNRIKSILLNTPLSEKGLQPNYFSEV